MIRFSDFEQEGLALAAFSEAADGNFSLRGDGPDGIEARRRFAESCGADPRMRRKPESPGARATPGKFCTALIASVPPRPGR